MLGCIVADSRADIILQEHKILMLMFAWCWGYFVGSYANIGKLSTLTLCEEELAFTFGFTMYSVILHLTRDILPRNLSSGELVVASYLINDRFVVTMSTFLSQ